MSVGWWDVVTTCCRAVEKRLLVRFCDRNPSPLQHLDLLLNVSYQQVWTYLHTPERKKAHVAGWLAM